MFCKNCGRELPEDAKFCVQCGASMKQKAESTEKTTETDTSNAEGSQAIGEKGMVSVGDCSAFGSDCGNPCSCVGNNENGKSKQC